MTARGGCGVRGGCGCGVQPRAHTNTLTRAHRCTRTHTRAQSHAKSHTLGIGILLSSPLSPPPIYPLCLPPSPSLLLSLSLTDCFCLFHARTHRHTHRQRGICRHTPCFCVGVQALDDRQRLHVRVCARVCHAHAHMRNIVCVSRVCVCHARTCVPSPACACVSRTHAHARTRTGRRFYCILLCMFVYVCVQRTVVTGFTGPTVSLGWLHWASSSGSTVLLGKNADGSTEPYKHLTTANQLLYLSCLPSSLGGICTYSAR